MHKEQSFGWGTIPGGCVAAGDRAAIAGDRAAIAGDRAAATA